tara:strand:+ start:188 stop:652 length:465 start_codon:yes stop_codon:yes gene_type:complete
LKQNIKTKDHNEFRQSLILTYKKQQIQESSNILENIKGSKIFDDQEIVVSIKAGAAVGVDFVYRDQFMAQELMFSVYSIIDSELKSIEDSSKKLGVFKKAMMKMKKNKPILSRFSQIQMEIQSIKTLENKSENKKTKSSKSLLGNSGYIMSEEQ